jgi:hypothetical protein
MAAEVGGDRVAGGLEFCGLSPSTTMRILFGSASRSQETSENQWLISK